MATKNIKLVFSGTTSDIQRQVKAATKTLEGYGVAIGEVNTKSTVNKKALDDLNQRHKFGAISTEVYNSKLKELNRTGTTTATVTGHITKTTRKSSEAVRKATAAVGHYNGTIKEVATNEERWISSQRLQISNALKYSVLYGGVAAVLYRVNTALSSIIERGTEMQATQAVFVSTFGSVSAAAEQFAYLDTVAQKYSLSISTLRKQYRSFATSAKLTGVSLEGTRVIFDNMARAARVLHLSNDDLQGAFRALTQIMSKGKLSAEELRQQLAERMPGAVAIMAKSLGITSQELDKLLEQGKLTADVLVNFAKEYGKTLSDQGLAEALKTLQAQSTAMVNVWDKLATGIFEKVEPALVSVTGALKVVFGVLAENLDSPALNTFGFLLTSIATVRLVKFGYSLLKGVGDLKLFKGALAGANLVQRIFARDMTASRKVMLSSMVALRGLKSLLALIGGPVGAAILAASGIHYLTGRIEANKRMIRSTTGAYEKYTTVINRAKNAVYEFANATLYEQRVARKNLIQDRLNTQRSLTEATDRQRKLAESRDRYFRQAGTYQQQGQKGEFSSQISLGKKASEEFAREAETVAALQNTLNHLNKALTEIDKPIETVTESVAQQTKTQEAANEKALEAINRLGLEKLALQGKHEEVFKLSKSYQAMSPELQKVALMQWRENQALKEAQKTKKGSVKVTNEQISTRQKLDKAYLTHKVNLKSEELQIGKNEIASYRLRLENEKLGKAQVSLSKDRINELVALKASNLEKKRLADTVKQYTQTLQTEKQTIALNRIELTQGKVARYEAELSYKGITGAIKNKLVQDYAENIVLTKKAKLQEKQIKLQEKIEKREKAAIAFRKALLVTFKDERKAVELATLVAQGYTEVQARRYQLIVDLAKAEQEYVKDLRELKDEEEANRILVEQGNEAYEDKLRLLKYLDPVLAANIKRQEELTKVSEAAAKQHRDMSEAIKDLIVNGDSVEDFGKKILKALDNVDLDNAFSKLTANLNKLITGKGSISDVVGSLNGLFVSGKGVSGIISNYGVGSGLAAALGGNKESQVGAGIGGVIGNIVPGIGGVIGSVVGGLFGSLFGGKKASAQAVLSEGNFNAYSSQNYAPGLDFIRESLLSDRFGLKGGNSGERTNVLGRSDENLPAKYSLVLDTMVAVDNAVANLVSETDVARAKKNLKDFSITTLDPEEAFKKRYETIIGSLSVGWQTLIDVAGSSSDEIIATVNELTQIQQSFPSVFESIGITLSETDSVAVGAIQRLAQVTGGLQSLSDGLATFASIQDSYSNDIENLKLRLLNNDEERYNYLKDKTDVLVSKLAEATDVNVINTLTEQIRSIANQALGLLTEEQIKKGGMGEQQLEFYGQIQDLALTRLQGAVDTQQDAQAAANAQKQEEAALKNLEAAQALNNATVDFQQAVAQFDSSVGVSAQTAATPIQIELDLNTTSNSNEVGFA